MRYLSIPDAISSEVISFVKELEDISAKFYEDISQRYGKDEDVFLAFVKENKKYAEQIQRAYYSVITDAIEAGYAFDLEADEYTLDTELPENASLADIANKALAIEEKIIACYEDGAEQSMSLLADIPRNFMIVVRKRIKRIPKLKSFA